MTHMDMHDARNELQGCGIYRDMDGLYPDFHTLGSEKIECILEVANERRYRKPRDANGSRARYFYQYLTRAAK